MTMFPYLHNSLHYSGKCIPTYAAYGRDQPVETGFINNLEAGVYRENYRLKTDYT